MMLRVITVLALLVGVAFGNSIFPFRGIGERIAARWLKNALEEGTPKVRDFMLADWEYNTNITQENSDNYVKIAGEWAGHRKKKGLQAQHFHTRRYKDESLKRQLGKIAMIGKSALEEEDMNRYNSIVKEMQGIYSVGKICPPDHRDCDLETEGWSLEPEIEDYISKSRDYEGLSYAWEAWRDVTGRKMKDLFLEYRDLADKAAQLNEMSDMSDIWLFGYQDDLGEKSFKEELERLWQDVFPLYEQLHAYIRHKLMDVYGQDYKAGPRGPIPAHLLGNMWAQSWENLYSITKPFSNTSEVDITESLVEQGYDAKRIFTTAEEFFTSIGFEPMPQSFWDRSIIEKPDDREIVCHASAWDFFMDRDVRIKMCTGINMEDFITVHHEMGHIEYFLLYSDLPLTYKEGANPGFHEAMGDTIALSVQTPQHLAKVNLLDEPDDTEEFNINYLFNIALQKLAFLPYGYLIDLFRWDAFGKVVEDSQLNQHYWEQRVKYQGIGAPVERDENDLDAAAKFHVTADTPYIRYFVAHLLQFSFYKSACEAAGQYPDLPLHKCDFYQSKEAGDKLRKGLELGQSKPWPETLELMTGKAEMDASAVLEYFQPLREFLEKYNKENNVEVGWDNQ